MKSSQVRANNNLNEGSGNGSQLTRICLRRHCGHVRARSLWTHDFGNGSAKSTLSAASP